MNAQTHDTFKPKRSVKSGRLGKKVKLAPKASQVVDPIDKLAMRATASVLLKDVDPVKSKNLHNCGNAVIGNEVALMVKSGADGGKTAYFTGTRTCKLNKLCPVCSARNSEKRRVEVNGALALWRSQRGAIHMLTLTAQHHHRQLSKFEPKLRKALNALKKTKSWKALVGTNKIKGVKPRHHLGNITCQELTYGEANGWHPHFHILIGQSGCKEKALARIEACRAEWLNQLRLQGLSGTDRAFHVQGASAAGSYVAKFGAAEEMALGDKKRGRKGSLTPMQILRLAAEGDKQCQALFVEYAKAVVGRAQLSFSPYLKGRVLEFMEKMEAESQSEAEPEPFVLRVYSRLEWYEARRYKSSILIAAQKGTCLDAAEQGQTDSQRWREYRAERQVIE